MSLFIRNLAAAATLSATAILGAGCDLLEALNDEGSTLIQLMVTHHATPQNGQFPDLSDGELRTFDNDEGWTVFLQTALVTTSHATLHACQGESIEFDSYWGPLPENIGAADLDLLSFAAVEVEAGQYCDMTVKYGPFTPTAEGMQNVKDELDGATYYFKGVAQKGELSIDFELSGSEITSVDLDISTVMHGGPLAISADEPFPVELTLSKTYDRFFDGMDFETASIEDLNANIMATLEIETRVSFGTRVAAE